MWVNHRSPKFVAISRLPRRAREQLRPTSCWPNRIRVRSSTRVDSVREPRPLSLFLPTILVSPLLCFFLLFLSLFSLPWQISPASRVTFLAVPIGTSNKIDLIPTRDESPVPFCGMSVSVPLNWLRDRSRSGSALNSPCIRRGYAFWGHLSPFRRAFHGKSLVSTDRDSLGTKWIRC